ncbi:TonB-dependent receptor [Rubrolithibacter danxiaensis]|uniref:TonB-dependent receptor n=1 Tax=Rubrolithibacter danxiaensis TaxID=3390805 RepID=UPI003BF81BDF
MIKTSALLSIVITLLLLSFTAFSQTTPITGRVVDIGTGQALSEVSVSVTTGDKTTGTQTAENGLFVLNVPAPKPFKLIISHLGYVTEERVITEDIKNLIIELEPENILGQEVVVSASRIPERILESPVSIERLGPETFRQTAAPSFYDAIFNLKGVEMSTQSLTFKSINTRGFNANGNTRFNQLVDGMDNQAPGLNFSIGNIVGLSDLDIDNIELLPGTSSALYGAGGTNGTLLMTSKSPFSYPGLTAQVRMGLTRDNAVSPDMSIRYAKVINKRLGIKIAGSYLNAKDWEATDYSNFNRLLRTAKSGDRNTDPAYDGVNVYGDEPNLKFPTLNQIGATVKAQSAQVPPGSLSEPARSIIAAYDNDLLPSSIVTRTGYSEKDLVDYDAKSIKTSAALYYKITDSTQAIAEVNYGIGTSIYTGSDRYSLQNFNIAQYKLELKGENFFVRGYTTQERSGDAYNATLLASLINESWKPSQAWFSDYTAAFAASRLNGASIEQANIDARSFADYSRPQPGTAAFNSLKKKISETNIGPENGARFNDRSNMYHYEGMYNFSSLLKNKLELLAGTSYRVYALNSDGTLFDDLNRDIRMNEYGAYTQIGKKFGERLKLTGSMRYDKNENFEGRLTPRITGVYTVAPNKNIRASYQTGFRNPTTQNQYIDLAVAGNSIRLIGGLPEIIKKYNLYTNKAYTDQSFRQFLATGNPSSLQEYTFAASGIQPERVQTFELGYKGLYKNNLLIDSYIYSNIYKNYITGVEVYQNPTPGSPTGLQNATRFNVPVNNTGRVTSWGMALGLDYRWKTSSLNGNVSYNKLSNIPEGYFNDFNTPEVLLNLGFSTREIGKNIGIYFNYRWQSSYYWQSPFVSGDVPSFGTLDGQISYRIPLYNSTIKIGGSNLFDKSYRTSYGNPSIGGMYYISLLFEQFLK